MSPDRARAVQQLDSLVLRRPVTISVRDEGTADSVRALVRSGCEVVVYDPDGTFPLFEICADGKAFRVATPGSAVAYGLFANVDDALRFGLRDDAAYVGGFAEGGVHPWPA